MVPAYPRPPGRIDRRRAAVGGGAGKRRRGSYTAAGLTVSGSSTDTVTLEQPLTLTTFTFTGRDLVNGAGGVTIAGGS
jgi:hypothetical protein